MSGQGNKHGFDSSGVLQGLKDFQRLTVDYIYRRLYEDEDRADRFLIADEVGLGKTLVARGVIALALQRLLKERGRIDIIYICSNGDIARQNINRLTMPGMEKYAYSTRVTLLPVRLSELEKNQVNLISFTPGTSFQTGFRSGRDLERALLYHLLRDEWGFDNYAGPKNMFQCDKGYTNWRDMLNNFEVKKIDPGMKRNFLEELREDRAIRAQYDSLLPAFAHYRRRRNLPFDLRQKQLKFIGELRYVLARSSLRSLKPGLVIMDEFQRFRDLLDGEEVGERLAQKLFNYGGVKVLLLSATPYKMYTMAHEPEDHYRDFVRTVKFLFDSREEASALEEKLRRYRLGLFQIGQSSSGELKNARDAIEDQLRKVMVRTERLAVSEDRDGMLETKEGLVEMAPEDLVSFKMVDRVARTVGAQDTMEYWKSAPYLLNLMEQRGYKLKEKIVQKIKASGESRELYDILIEGAPPGLLTRAEVAAYKRIDPGNARLRAFLSSTVERGTWKLLWIPPSLPYYKPEGNIFSKCCVRDFTKVLVFSSWKIVPKVIAALCSYEAERRMTRLLDKETNYYEERAKRSPLLSFTYTRERLTGMPNLNLLYPCWTLAAAVDPLQEALKVGRGELLSLNQIKKLTAEKIDEWLKPLIDKYAVESEPKDEQWYWAALALLDREHSFETVESWLSCTGKNRAWREMVAGRGEVKDEDSRFAEHVDFFCSAFRSELVLGQPPEDLADVLVKTALASPAVAVLRSLIRLCPPGVGEDLSEHLMAEAARCALGFRTMFNLAESITLIRGDRGRDRLRYWESVLDYCCEGNLQAVMDEYVHILRDDLGLLDWDEPEEDLKGITGEIQTALSIRTASLNFDEFIPVKPGKIKLERASLRCRYALRFGQDRDEERDQRTRSDQVRRAFNSPFRPFVLATTSIGQEGLDFHQYCHDLYHWNLPANPVDLEQREGRVHRYKGHAIRRNLAGKYGLSALVGNMGFMKDPWELLFQRAVRDRGKEKNDLVPFWIFEGVHKIRRNIPSLPLSREVQQLDYLRRALVSYRMVFGQPRQEDLLDSLECQIGEEVDLEELAKYRIDLSPLS